jgi:hypothetical protein
LIIKGNVVQEYERLERLAFDTIQRRTNVAELPANRRRNRSVKTSSLVRERSLNGFAPKNKTEQAI